MVDITQIEKRTFRSFYDDGLFEIALGLALLAVGALLYWQTVLPDGSLLNTILTSGFVVVLVSSGFLVNLFVRFFKRRVTYPRSGYVAFKSKSVSPRRRTATMIVAGIIGGSLAALTGLSPAFRSLWPAAAGILAAVAVLIMANRIGLTRFYILAGAAAVIGPALAAAGTEMTRGISYFFGLFGLAWLVSGVAALLVYLGRSPRPGADGAEGPDAR
jgi:hypothetical protein